MSAFLRTRLAREARDQSGFTMAELIVVVMLMGVFGILIQTGFVSLNNVSASVENRSVSLGEIRAAEERVARDLRAANPIQAVLPSSLYDTQASFTIYCSNAGSGFCASNNLETVTYKLSANAFQEVIQVPGGGTVTRTLVGPAGPTNLPAAKQRGAVVNASSEPVFIYYDKNGNPFTTQGGSPTPGTSFRDCTKSVQIDLKVLQEPNKTTNPLNVVTVVNLRNFNQVNPC